MESEICLCYKFFRYYEMIDGILMKHKGFHVVYELSFNICSSDCFLTKHKMFSYHESTTCQQKKDFLSHICWLSGVRHME